MLLAGRRSGKERSTKERKENLCILSSDNLTDREKKNNTKMHATCQWQRLMNLLPFTSSAKHPLSKMISSEITASPGFIYSYCTYWSFWKILFLIKSVSVRGLNSLLICQIPIKLVSFRYVSCQSSFSKQYLHVPMSLDVHTHTSHTFSGAVHYGQGAWVNLTVCDPAVLEIYNRSHCD